MTWSLIVTLLVAQDGSSSQCLATDELSPTRMLRRLSLDLRNRVPSLEEMSELEENVPESIVDAYLQSEGFVQVMREHHADLLWPDLGPVELVPESHLLYPYPLRDGTVLFYSPLRALLVRQTGNTNLYTPCRNEPAEFDADGHLVLEEVRVGDEVVAYTEGYLEVEPYWAPGTTIKVCGFDALDNPVGEVCPGPRERYPFADQFCRGIGRFENLLREPFRGSTVSCNSPTAFLSPDCGCGPNLENCATQAVVDEIEGALVEQQMRLVEDMVRSGAPYESLLTGTDIEWNGKVIHYLRYHAPLVLDVYSGELEDWNLPDLSYMDPQWVRSPRSARHAGVLTSPGFLLRFATDRMRAHRYYNAFECSAFTPSGPLPSPFEPCSQEEDLTKRCGCDSCHLTLEPLASMWGRFVENGFGELSETRFPTQAAQAGCSFPVDGLERYHRCIREYELQPSEQRQPYRGLLNAYVFKDPGDYTFIEQGPRLRVQEAMGAGIIQRCLATRMYRELMRREPTPEEMSSQIPAIVAAFEAEGRDLKAMVRAIVSLDAYRSAP